MSVFFPSVRSFLFSGAAAIAALWMPGTSHASNFLPTAHEWSRKPAAEQARGRQDVARVTARSRVSTEPVAIGDMLFRSSDLMKRSGFTGTQWTSGVVYYQFDPAVTAENRGRFVAAAAEWSAAAKVTFVEDTGVGNYVHVQNSTVNNSYLGMIGGEQVMNISAWSSKFTIAHEIGHALGLQHEQCRSDRDAYVTVFPGNIVPGKESQFAIAASVTYGAYDFDSVMHYSREAFSANGQDTLQPTTPYLRFLDTIGQSSHLSVWDKAGMAERYGPKVVPKKLLRYQRKLRHLREKLQKVLQNLTGHAETVAVRKIKAQMREIQALIKAF